MPAFFALSGLFAVRAVQLPTGKFLAGRIKTILYPYVLWTGIILIAQLAMARFVNTPPEPYRALRLFLEPYGFGLWFLYALFLVSTLFYLMARVKLALPLIVAIGCGLFLASARNVFGFWPILNMAMSYFVFYAGGAFVGEKMMSGFSEANRWLCCAAGVTLLLATVILWVWHVSVGVVGGLTAAFLGIAGIFCLAQAGARMVGRGFWALLGFFSLEIYLGHPLWSTFTRAVLLRIHVHSAAAIVLGCVLLGIGGSLGVGLLSRQWHFPYLFRWPDRARA